MGDKTQAEHNESAHSPIADMRADIDFCREGPKADISVQKLSSASCIKSSALLTRIIFSG